MDVLFDIRQFDIRQFDSRHLVDLVIACIVLEVLALAVWRSQRLWPALPSLAAGLAMALALRCALFGSPWHWVWLCMALAGAAHTVEVMRRWRSPAGPRTPARTSSQAPSHTHPQPRPRAQR